MSTRNTAIRPYVRIVFWPGEPDTRRRTVYEEVSDGETLGDAVGRVIDREGITCAPTIYDSAGVSHAKAEGAAGFRGESIYVFDASRDDDASRYFGGLE